MNCYDNELEKLDLDCSLLEELDCYGNKLTSLNLNCPALQKLSCGGNLLSELEMNYPHLRNLSCEDNPLLTHLNGLEFCSELEMLCCSEALKESVEIFKVHLPGLTVEINTVQ